MTINPLSGGQHFHSIIIGGGIQGCGVAQALAAAGFSALLVEKNTLGSGTSSKSSKLIHGGLRYLASGQLGLVRQSLQERALLLKLAPSLIERRPFYLPVYRNSRIRPFVARAGLTLYSLLGGLHADNRFRKLPRRQWQTLAGIELDGLQAVYAYCDAQTDDQRLTQAVGHSASELGATMLEHCSFVGAQLVDAPQRQGNATNTAEQIAVTLQPANGNPVEVSCDLLINASGPWVSETLEHIEFAPPPPKISLVQGTHVELDTPISDAIFYVENPDDKRPVFVMPSANGTLVGTTETQHTGTADDCQPTPQEVDYLLKTLKHYFPDYSGKITASWAGLRVLPSTGAGEASDTRQFSDQSRDTMIDIDRKVSPRLISLYGGKLTTYRATAEKVAALVLSALASKNIQPQQKPLSTATLVLSAPPTNSHR